MVSNSTLRLALLSLLTGLSVAQENAEDGRNYRSVTLADASARVAPDFRPKLLGELVRVKGIVQTAILEASDASYLAILDAENKSSGLLLLYSGDNKSKKPAASEAAIGSIVEVSGIVSLHAGQAVVKPMELLVKGQSELPKPPMLTPLLAASFDYEGMLVEVAGEVAEFREGSWGDLLDFKEGGKSIQVFLPIPGRSMERPLAVYQKGDKIRVKGLVTQFCLRPPYNQYFQLMVASPMDIQLMEPRPAVPPQIVPAAVVVVLLAILAAWYAQQRSRWQQRTIQEMLINSEEIYGMGTAREVAESLRNHFLKLTSGESATLYHFDGTRKVLERIPDQSSSAPHSFHVEECSSLIEHALAQCVGNRTIVHSHNTQSAETLHGNAEPPRSILVIPMRNRNETRGAILVTGLAGKQLLPVVLQPAAQHIANDASQCLEVLEQSVLREQNHRSEKLAVAGQLIHGVITELNTPLEKIRDLTAALTEHEAAPIHAQVKKASETVRRIVAVARAEQIDARPVDLRFLFQRLMEEMDEELRQGQIEPEVNLGPESLYVLGSQDQLIRVFENLFLHAKAAATYSLEHVFVLNLNRLGRSAMLELEFSGPFGEGEGPDFSGSALGLAITRGLLQSYGGDARFATIRAGRYRYDVELPSLNASPAEDFAAALPFSPQRGMITALMVEPELQSQRKMLSIFGELNHRLIPVSNVEEAADLAEKLRFDIVFASARPEGGTWADLFRRIHHRTPHFVLMSESAEEYSTEILDGTASSMLRKPIEDADVLSLIDKIQQRN
jgi:CheY-like chemotaxis protein